MNFFEEQDKARRRTWLLVLYFTLAVALIALAINLVAYLGARYIGLHSGGLDAWLQQPHWMWITGATLLVIGTGSILAILKLRSGGEAVARMVGARLLDRDTSELSERRLVNVADEMSIASGTPAPAIYVMDEEPGINAFVAGLRPTEAVLVVTRGALENLDRDELQGVVGHEYSHILNGDMRLNIRLLGVLAGILVIGQLGGFLLRSLRFSGSRRSRIRGQGGLAVLGLGLALFAIGYVGLFFGRLIKAAISRQREFLADASSVQFTRNPAGIAGALWKIDQHPQGATLASAHAEDMSHMCFGQSLTTSFQSWLATHPPIDVRIERVDPAFSARRLGERARQRMQSRGARTAPAPPPGSAAAGFTGPAPAATSAADIADSVGNPSAEQMAYATRLHAALPPALLSRVHQPRTAKAVVYALLLTGTHREQAPAARGIIEAADGADAAAETLSACADVQRLDRSARLPLLELAMPALRSLEARERARFLGAVRELARADRRMTLFEFALMVVLDQHLGSSARAADKTRYYKYSAVKDEIRLLLTVLSRAGTRDAGKARETFQQVMASFGHQQMEPSDARACTPAALTGALRKLNQLSPLLKRTLITACADCVLHDGRVLPSEAELLRATALSLGCPMPPLTPPAPAA